MEWKVALANGKDFTYRETVDGLEWEFRSNSGQKIYTVKLNSKSENNYERAGTLSCNCPAWIFNHGHGGKKRWCSHCKIVMKELDTTNQLDVVKHRIDVHQDAEWW